jgi:hypothetical protein
MDPQRRGGRLILYPSDTPDRRFLVLATCLDVSLKKLFFLVPRQLNFGEVGTGIPLAEGDTFALNNGMNEINSLQTLCL